MIPTSHHGRFAGPNRLWFMPAHVSDGTLVVAADLRGAQAGSRPCVNATHPADSSQVGVPHSVLRLSRRFVQSRAVCVVEPVGSVERETLHLGRSLDTDANEGNASVVP